MSVTQKYKQQQQQVRVHTSENNYLRGMYFSDVPLAEGYSRVLVNFDIDSLSGKLSPRKGLQSLGVVKPADQAKPYLHNTSGFNTIVDSKVCAASDSQDKRKVNNLLQAALYNTDTRGFSILTCSSEADTTENFKAIPFTLNSEQEYVAPEPFVIDNPGVHGKDCAHNSFFKKPVGTFAFGNQYYTFLKRSRYTVEKLAELPNDNPAYAGIVDYATLIASPVYGDGGSSQRTPGQYFKFTSGVSEGTLAYYVESADHEIILQPWYRSEEALQQEIFSVTDEEYILCYTKIGSEIQLDEVLLDKTLDYSELDPDTYYTCQAIPKQNNPTEAASWGYNMLLSDPYMFTCEKTAINLVTITGILPYDKSEKVVLTPRKNQEITLKAYFRAPAQYHSDAQNARFYTTTKKRIQPTGESTPRDPKTINELNMYVLAPYTDNNFGDWWYCYEEGVYYMIMTDNSTVNKKLAVFGTTQPAASVQMTPLTSGVENKIRVRWQMRSAGASTWTELYNEVYKLSDYYTANNDDYANGQITPFTITTALPDDEVIIKLTITDADDVASGEEYVLSTNTIGLSLISDELANNLNLDAKTYILGKCTGMCEWEKRIVLWGVPDALNTLFISDINNPTFFPYPNNIDVFTDPIISVHNYGNELLVLTASALYRLSWDTEGNGWTHKLVQQNLHVTEADTYMSCVIKNMFFFKSGEYYYMMVPKASSKASVVGEVTIAPISKPIEKLLDNFHEEVYNLIKVMINQDSMADFTNYLVNYFSYVDNTKAVVNYVYDLNATIGDQESVTNSEYLYVQLIYDTDTRAWTMRAFEAPHMLFASHADAIQQDRFIDITPSQTTDKLVMQYYKFKEFSDYAIQYLDDEDKIVYSVPQLKDYQYLDTGNREINTEMKKRFREFQFKLKNKTNTNLGFYTAFLVDGSLRRDLQRYSPRYILDPTTNEPVIIVERVLDPDSLTYNVTFVTRVERFIIPQRMLQDAGELTPTTLAENTDADQWILNQAAFPGRTLWKVRMPISGKGLTPRAILLSTNQAEYEILGDSWVYRTMNAR